MGTAHIKAISVGHGLSVNSASFGIVHSVFSQAINLIVGGDMWTLLAMQKVDRPFGIRVTLSNFDSIGLRSGDPVNIRAGYVGIASRLVIDCRAAVRWAPPYQSKPERGLEQRLAMIATAAADRSWTGSAQMARELRSAFDDTTKLGGLVAKVVGRGPGATPSGDDVLVGILAVLTSPYAGISGAAVANLLSCAIRPVLPSTNEISAHLLRQAACGLFGRDIHELVHGLHGGFAPVQFSEKVHRIVETGATSGADMCEGLLAFAPYFFLNHIETAAA